MKDIEKILQNANAEDVKIPIQVENRIEYVLNNIDKYKKKSSILKNKKRMQFKLIPALSLGIICATGVSFACTYVIKQYFYKNEGMNTAIENGYIINNATEYIDASDAKVKVDQLILDDYNLGIVCNIELGEIKLKNYLENVYKFEFKNTLVLDENNNVLFAKYENQEDFDKYSKKMKLDKGKYSTGYSNGSYTGKILSKNSNGLIFSFNTASNKFPNSKKLYIKFDTMKLLNRDERLNKNIEGIWELSIDLQEMQKERKTIEYSVVNKNDDKTVVTKSSLSMSNMQLELVTNSDKIDFDKLKNREKMNVIDMIPFHDVYIETQDGKKFFQTSTGGNGYNTLDDGRINYHVTFNYTYFNKSEIIKIVLPTNKREEIIIELKAKKFETQ